MAELSTLGHVIKAAYEGQPNTNAFTDAEKAKLAGLSAVATSGSFADLTNKPPVMAVGNTVTEARDAIDAMPRPMRGAPNGVAPLDASAKVPLEHLNVSGLSYLGAWDASTNSPALSDGQGSDGDFFKCSVAGTQDFGDGEYTFGVGDWVIYAGGHWQRIGVHEAVASVNGKTGAVQLTAADVGALPNSYSPSWPEVSGKPDFDALYAPKPRGGFSAPVLAVSAGLSGTVAVASGVTKAITWATPSIDPFSMHNGTTGFVVPSWAVLARATLKMTMGPNPNGYRWAAVRLNGSDVHADRRNAIPATWTNLNLHSIAFPVTPGAVIDFTVFQNSGSEIGIADNAIFQIELYSLN